MTDSNLDNTNKQTTPDAAALEWNLSWRLRRLSWNVPDKLAVVCQNWRKNVSQADIDASCINENKSAPLEPTIIADVSSAAVKPLPDLEKREKLVYAPSLTFSQLDSLVDSYCRFFNQVGIVKGVKTLLLVRPGIDFFAIGLALFRSGAIPILVDPGMGIKRLLECVAGVEPQAMVSIPLGHLASIFMPNAFKQLKIRVTVGGYRWFWSGTKLQKVIGAPADIVAMQPDEVAAILFTSGSTGPAKGVEYSSRMLQGQCDAIRNLYGIDRNDIDLSAFAPFAMFSVLLGMTAIIPKMDVTRPAKADPLLLADAILSQKCTFSFGSPVLWRNLAVWASENQVKFPHLRQVMMAGAPVPDDLHATILPLIAEDGNTHAPYGATECLPVASYSGREALSSSEADFPQAQELIDLPGVCVGRTQPGVALLIIPISDAPISALSEIDPLGTEQIGEVVVSGAVVSRHYYHNTEADSLHKIHDKDGVVWHRIGDLGYLDSNGYLWFCGRKSHRIVTAQGLLCSVCVEKWVRTKLTKICPIPPRVALIGWGNRPEQVPGLVIEGENNPEISQLLLANLDLHPLLRQIKQVFYCKSFPVDIRHNAKIDREILAKQFSNLGSLGR